MFRSTKLLLLLALTISCLTAYGTDSLRYHTVNLTATTIKSALTNTRFHHFKFKYFSLSTGYILKGYAQDSRGNNIGSQLTLQAEGTNASRITNIERGTLTLTKEKMIATGMDGTFDCILIPKKYNLGKPEQMDYVSYRVKEKNKNSHSVFTEFDLDPSPPARLK
jgi:hypothetical protein